MFYVSAGAFGKEIDVVIKKGVGWVILAICFGQIFLFADCKFCSTIFTNLKSVAQIWKDLQRNMYTFLS